MSKADMAGGPRRRFFIAMVEVKAPPQMSATPEDRKRLAFEEISGMLRQVIQQIQFAFRVSEDKGPVQDELWALCIAREWCRFVRFSREKTPKLDIPAAPKSGYSGPKRPEAIPVGITDTIKIFEDDEDAYSTEMESKLEMKPKSTGSGRPPPSLASDRRSCLHVRVGCRNDAPPLLQKDEVRAGQRRDVVRIQGCRRERHRRDEFINIPKDDALSSPTPVHRTYPSTVTNKMEDVVAPFVRKSVAVNNTLLDVLNKRLGLPDGTLANLHKMDEPSGSEARCIKTPRDQRFAPRDRGLEPLPGHAICNLGDAMTIFSGGILHSNFHCVVPPPKAQSAFERWSLVFFTRPNTAQILALRASESMLIAAAVNGAPETNFDTGGSSAGKWFAHRVKNQHIANRTGPLVSR
ncbi:hypothetical protein OF83DRAFT_1088732 [Amylostereum chailletii]|nr:hypothetical protein OF83DRAFT_1088732 [Amylostereum chailletii]